LGPASLAGQALGHLGVRLRLLRSVLLLEPPLGAYRRAVLGVARGASPERGVQPHHRPAAARHRRLPELDLLSAHGAVRHTRGGYAAGRRRPTLLPVLAAHAAHRPAGFPGPVDTDALEPSRASRAERRLPR